MPRYAMVIDRQRCVGCGACSIACRTENNVSEGVYWSHKITETSGVFPNVRFHYLPTLCNHCTDAPCVRGCPTRAMHKTETGITMHDPKKCIGCRYCMINCPYGVIYFNWKDSHQFWKNKEELLPGGTSSPAEEVRAVNGKGTPYYNPQQNSTTPDVSPRGWWKNVPSANTGSGPVLCPTVWRPVRRMPGFSGISMILKVRSISCWENLNPTV